MAKRVLVTSALPYANGPIHFGHVVGAYLPADIYVRTRRLMGEEVLYVCGTDEHGVTIVQSAAAQGTSCQDSVDRWHRVIKGTFDDFQIEFDIFSGTSAGRNPFHAPLSQHFFSRLKEQGYVNEREVKQLYCTRCELFLADRYVEGTCPKCGHQGARGDECGSCGSWIDALELKDPRCKQCGATPQVRETRHWYLDLPRLQEEKIGAWFKAKAGRWKPNVKLFVENMLKGLKERPITRDLDWGVPLPSSGGKGKVLYVWFDAPIGYISATMQYCADRGRPDEWRRWWQDEETELVHFIGKDNIPFHVVVFPAMLYGVKEGYILPANVPANEFYNLEGGKFSTSGGWFIPLEKFFSEYSSDAARYALISNAPETRDSEFTWRYFQAKVNNDLADNLGNLAARVVRFAERYMEGRIPAREAEPTPAEEELLACRAGQVEAFTAAVLAFDFRRAANLIMDLSRRANRVFDAGRPWQSRKEEPARAATTISICAEALRTLAFLCTPVMPRTGAGIWRMLGLPGSPAEAGFTAAATEAFTRGGKEVEAAILFQKIPDERIEAEEAAMQERMRQAAGVEPLKEEIGFDDFARLDLRVGQILGASAHPKADRLLVLQVDIGLEERTILAGVAGQFEPEELVGRKIVVAANLAPKKLRGIESRGMLLAATPAEGELFLLDPGADMPPGTVIG